MDVYTIQAPVGNNGTNRRDDVAVVQFLLNNVPPSKGGANPELAKDGKCGPKTIGAICRFQKTQFGWQDGLVEPAKVTIQTLNSLQPVLPEEAGSCGCDRPYVPPLPNALERSQAFHAPLSLNFAMPVTTLLAAPQPSLPLPGHEDPDARTEVYVPQVPPSPPPPPLDPASAREVAIQNCPAAETWMVSAMRALRSLIECGGDPAKIQLSPAFATLKRHFHLTVDDLKPKTFLGFPTNDPHNFLLNNLENIYNTMIFHGRRAMRETVFLNHPNDGGNATDIAFLPMPRDGFLYWTPLYLKVSPTYRILTVVHELSHYVTNGRITDWLYRWEKPAEYTAMSSDQALSNADNYAYFAFNCQAVDRVIQQHE